MLKLIETHDSVGTAHCTHDWRHDCDKILETIRNAFPDRDSRPGYYAHPDEHALQGRLLETPSLQNLHAQLLESGLKAMVINNFGLTGFSPEDRNAILYATALALGFPTSTDQSTNRVLWDVKARPKDNDGDGRFQTFSERTGKADMHTDSSFFPMPEENFLLYTARSARCGGGKSCLIDVEDILTSLVESRAGRAALQSLTEPIPFRVPTLFAGRQDAAEIGLYPVFSVSMPESPEMRMRWRHDAIIKGFQARPDMATPQLMSAVDIVHHLIENHAPCFRRYLEDDTLLWADNHRMLHGRTHYDDPERHLIRIRISRIPNAERIGPSGISSD